MNTITLPTLKEGSRGAEVIKLQETLKQLNFYSGAIDGIFGSQTKDAVVNLFCRDATCRVSTLFEEFGNATVIGCQF